jgi:putative phage-type endonuclease
VTVREIIVPRDRDHWLQLRTQDITSTEVSALWNLSPYKTPFELWHEKRDGVVVNIKPSERMVWGTRLQDAIARGVAEDQGWDVAPFTEYVRDPEARIGSSFDWLIKAPGEPGILEIKTVDPIAYRKGWKDDGSGSGIEAPEHIEFQVQHQMEVADLDWCAIVALVGGNTVRVVRRQRDRKIGEAIRTRVARFWQSIESGAAPAADFDRDADLVLQLYNQSQDDEVFDATGDAEIARLVAQYQQTRAQIDQLDTLAKTYRAQVLKRIGTASKVIADWGSITTSTTKDTPAKLITADMVGTTTGGRKGHRQFLLNIKETSQ